MPKDYSMEELLQMVQEKALEYKSDRITSAADAYASLAEYACKNQEHFMLITLDGASRVIEKRVIFIGTLNQSLVHPREVFRPAISDNSAGIIIAHNHPVELWKLQELIFRLLRDSKRLPS